MTKSHILVTNALARIDILEGKLANESKIHLKHGRPIDSKYITPRKLRKQRKVGVPEEENIRQKAPVEAYGEQEVPIEAYGEQEALIEPL